jgi:uncharacterized membrane protein
VAAAPARAAEPDPRRSEPGPAGWILAGLVLTVAAAVVLRFVTRSDLWLDEALTVNLAKLPLSDLREALRHDGAPPLFYVLLH